MYFGANSRCRIENSVEKAAVFLHPVYITGLKIVPRAFVGAGLRNFKSKDILCAKAVGLEANTHVWKRNYGTSSRSIFLVKVHFCISSLIGSPKM